MASRRTKQQEEVRLKVMRMISSDSEVSTRRIARAVNISNGSAYYVISELVKKGFVKFERFRKNPKKSQYSYLLTPTGIREKSLLTHRFIKQKREEFKNLQAEIETLEVEARSIEIGEFFKENSQT